MILRSILVFIFLFISLQYKASSLDNGFHCKELCIVDIIPPLNGSIEKAFHSYFGNYNYNPPKFRRIPDNYTRNYILSKITFNPAEYVKWSKSVSLDDINSVEIDESNPIPSLNVPDANYDIVTLKYVNVFEIIQGKVDIMYDLVSLKGCINPSIAPWRGLYLLVCRSSIPLGGPPKLAWLNASTLVPIDFSKYGLYPGFPSFDNIKGEDFRLFELKGQDKVILTYTHYHYASGTRITHGPKEAGGVYAQMEGALISIQKNESTSKEYIEISHDHHLESIRKEHATMHQKNWCPFSYMNETAIIHSLNPMVTYILQESTHKDYIVSTSKHFIGPKKIMHWWYGEIKGGTNARRIAEDTYLAFFHSKQLFPPNRASYVFGAYTFDAHPPFGLKKFSLVPIVKRSMYEGEWSHWKNLIDYIVFPMTFVIYNAENSESEFDYRSCQDKCQDETELLLSIGLQDVDGVLVKMRLGDVLKTLVTLDLEEIAKVENRVRRNLRGRESSNR